jgi:hypothetical protein
MAELQGDALEEAVWELVRTVDAPTGPRAPLGAVAQTLVPYMEQASASLDALLAEQGSMAHRVAVTADMLFEGA